MMKSAPVAQMAFSIPELIAELSFGMPPGDVIITGTPSGLGMCASRRCSCRRAMSCGARN